MSSNKRKIWFFSSLTVAVSVIILLVTGSPLLTMPLGYTDAIPLGTLITWAGMISLPLSIYWGIGEFRQPRGTLNQVLSVILKVLLVLAILWVPIAYFLAGNLSFTFSEKETFQGGQTAMKLFWVLSYGIGGGAIFTLLIYWISLLLRKMFGGHSSI